jgi:hypothetical protein
VGAEVVLGTVDDRWNSPKVGLLLSIYGVVCCGLAALLLREPLDLGPILIFFGGAVYFGWYVPSRPKKEAVDHQTVPPEIVTLVDEIRNECGVQGLKVLPHRDPDYPDIFVGSDELKLSKKVCEEWSPGALRWTLRNNLHKYKSIQVAIMFMVVAVIPAYALMATSSPRNTPWQYMVVPVAGVLLFFVIGSRIERRDKRARLDYAQSFETNIDAATFALSYPYYAQLDEFRGKDRTWVNTDIYQEAAKYLSIKLVRPSKVVNPGGKADEATP